MPKSGFKVLFFFLLITTLGCNNKSSQNRLNKTQQKFEQCLYEWKNCSELLTTLDDGTNFTNYFKGIWFSRMGKHEIADSLFKTCYEYFTKTDITNERTQTFFLEYLSNQIHLENKLNIIEEERLLQLVRPTNPKHQSFIIALLLVKASKLMELREVNYSYSTILYSIYLQNKHEIENYDLIFIPYYYLGILDLREGKIEKASLNFNKAYKICRVLDEPICKKILLLSNFILPNENNSPSQLFIESIKVDPSSASKIYNDIETHLSYLLPKKNSTFSTKSFFERIYMIENLVENNNLEEAGSYLDSLYHFDIPNQYKFLSHFISAKNYQKQYKLTCHPNYLKKSNRMANEALIFFNANSDEQNLHLADYQFRINNILLENIYSKNKIDVNFLASAKQSYSRILNISSTLEDKIVSDAQMEKYSDLVQSIERLELDINNYNDITSYNTSSFELLYNLHNERHQFLKSIKNGKPSNKEDIQNPENEILDFVKDNDILVIDIIATDSNYYITSVCSDSVFMQKLNKSVIDSLIDQLKREIENKITTNKRVPSQAKLFKIFRQFLKSKYKNIIVIPDQKTTELPFELLEIAKDSFGNPLYVCDYFNVSYNFNIRNICVPNINYQSSIASVFSFTSQNTILNRKPLIVNEQPHGYKEALEIAQLNFKTSIYSGKKLNKETIFKNLDTSILHFSTHASSSSSNILDNYMYVRDNNGNPEKMYGFEVKHKKIDNSLVILSSCNSGTGTYKPGAGVFSLSRDFLQAGAQTVIKSLWAVNEASTAELMVDFHRNFTQGHTASMALTLAKRKLKKDPKYAHPYYWAGFVLEGNPNVFLEIE